MKTTVIFIALVISHTLSLVESGYLVTSPRLFRASSTQELSVSLVDITEPWVINSTLTYRKSGDIIASNGAQFTSDTDGILKLKIPRDLNTGGKQSIEAKLSISGGPLDGEGVFSKSEMISILIPKNSVFIQTDKPVYKPGQTVNMRIVGVDENLRPLKGQVKRVTITSPGDVRTKQWNDQTFVGGIVSLNFALSSQPVLGDWKIEVVYQGEKETVVFKVDKYVLPKFEVTVEPPAFVSLHTKEITATICARYTYGQPVKGTMAVLFHLKMPRYWKHYETQTTRTVEINGCRDVTITTDKLKTNLRQNYFSLGKISINATVKESATGVSQNASGTEVEVVSSRAKLKFLPTTSKTFKPGMAYSGQLKATLPDGSPMKGESVHIIIKERKSDSWSWYYDNGVTVFQERITVQANGLVDFLVPGSNIQTAKLLSLQAKYKGKTLAYHTAKRWNSPSSSYISMERIVTPLKVGIITLQGLTFMKKPWGQLAPTFSDLVTSKSISVKSVKKA